MIKQDFTLLDNIDFSELSCHMDKKNVEMYYREYIKLDGKDDLETYIFRLSSFFYITVKAFTMGNLGRLDGSYWKSREHSLNYWADQYDLNNTETSKYFQSVDNILPYTQEMQ